MEHGSLGVLAAETTASQLLSTNLRDTIPSLLQPTDLQSGRNKLLMLYRVLLLLPGRPCRGGHVVVAVVGVIQDNGDQPVDLWAPMPTTTISSLLVSFPGPDSHSLGPCTPLLSPWRSLNGF